MTEPSIKELDPRFKKQVDNAEKSIGKNAGYAIEVCTGILSRNPGCVEVRKILRKAQKSAGSQKTKGLSKLFGSVTQAPVSMKATSLLKKDPQQAMEAAEKLITANPANAIAHKVVGQAAEALQLWNTAAFAYQCWAELEPSNTAAVVAMGNALIQAGRPREAITACDGILLDNPGDEAAQAIVRKAAVAETMEKGKWEEEGGFREKLADEGKAVALEQEARAVNDADTIRSLIDKGIARLREEPNSLNVYRDIINNYRRLADFDQAIVYLEKARALPEGQSDPTLERLHMDLRVQQMTRELSVKTQALQADPENAQLQAEVERLQAEAHAFRLKNARALVEKYPNDYLARFELGKLLLADGQLDPAIQQFQLAQKNPKVRVQAILHLGRAYLEKKFYDLAAEQLAIAKAELSVMNDLKKEVIYELALACEKMGDASKAIDEYKAIYASDIGYRDVADKINAFYAKQQSGS